MLAVLPAQASTAIPVPTGRYAHHELSGFAISGFDPVAYFVEGKAVGGRAAHELLWSEAAWRFASSANAAAFKSNPEIYAPQFGGYDAEAMSRGLAVPGDPSIFLVLNDRLYLFRTEAARDAFVTAPEHLAAAQANWLKIRLQLSRR